jgi:hypothetical protein
VSKEIPERRRLQEKDLAQAELNTYIGRAQLAAGLLIGIGALANLYFTSRNLRVANRTLETSQRGQVSQRFTQAIEQLGAIVDRGEGRKAEPNLEVRLGAIYALESIARDSPQEYLRQVTEVLAANVRMNAPRIADSESQPHDIRPRFDIQTVLTVIGRSNLLALDLRQTDLRGAELAKANLQRAQLGGADLRRANLNMANLALANLRCANLEGAFLGWASLWRAYLGEANLWGAHLGDANLQEASLIDADLRGANLRGARLQGAYFADPTAIDSPSGRSAAVTWGQLLHSIWDIRTTIPSVVLAKLPQQVRAALATGSPVRPRDFMSTDALNSLPDESTTKPHYPEQIFLGPTPQPDL